MLILISIIVSLLVLRIAWYIGAVVMDDDPMWTSDNWWANFTVYLLTGCGVITVVAGLSMVVFFFVFEVLGRWF